MIFGVLIELATGMLCIVLGLLLWKKQKITLLHVTKDEETLPHKWRKRP